MLHTTNFRYKVNGMHFDAAIDWEFELHAYTKEQKDPDILPIELYNLDKDWDITMIYIPRNTEEEDRQAKIITETEKWCKEWLKNGEYTSLREMDDESTQDAYEHSLDAAIDILDTLAFVLLNKEEKDNLNNKLSDIKSLLLSRISK